MEKLTDKLITYGGAIVSSASLPPHEIENAKIEGRMHVDIHGYGFVYIYPVDVLKWAVNYQ